MYKEFEIYFDDLTEDAQMRLLETVGADGPEEWNWDTFIPIAVVDFELEEENSSDA